MQRACLWFIASSILLTGCWSTTPHAPDTSTSEAEDGSAVDRQQPDTSPDANREAPSDVAHEPSLAPVQPEAEPLLVELPSPGVPPEPVRQSVRLLMLTSEGPLVVAATLSIDGRPYKTAMQKLLDQFIELADSNADGVAHWDEVVESPHFRYGQFGNELLNRYTEKQQAKRKYDTNVNGRLDRSEVPAFLTQNNGQSQAFQLRRSRTRGVGSKSRSGVMRLLDHDEDGRLGEDEIANAAVRLRSRDADADEILTPDDFVVTNVNRGGMQRGERSFGPDSSILLDDAVDWQLVSYAMDVIYGGDLSVDKFRLAPELHTLLDLDADGLISEQELKGLESAAANVHLHLEFGQLASGENEALPRLRLVKLSTSLQQQTLDVVEADQQLTLRWNRLQMGIYLSDDFGVIDFQRQAQMQVNQADANGNGYLEASEFPENLVGQAPFEALDRDGDGRLYAKDLAEVLSQRQAIPRSQIVARAEGHADGLFSALDTNSDGRVAAREIANAPSRLHALDRNQDKVLSTREFPYAIEIVFTRGDAARGDALFDVANLAVTETPGPRWFRRMDANADGDLSAAEFLGTAQQFRDLDANADGFLTPGEVQALGSSVK